MSGGVERTASAMAQEESVVPVSAVNINSESSTLVRVNRPTLTISNRLSLYGYFSPQRPGVCEKERGECFSRGRLWAAVKARLPILHWLSEYRLRHALLGDVTAGVTVGVMHIPEGMAFAMLASLPAITGLYMAFFPALVYMLMGTSRHLSIGTFAVSCMMMEKLVLKLSTEDTQPTTRSGSPDDCGTLMNIMNSSQPLASFPSTTTTYGTNVSYSGQEVAAAIALTVGIWEVLMGGLQLGQIFSAILSNMIISGFTTSVAFHVISSQLQNLLGITVHRYSGPFKIFYMYRDLFLALPMINPAVVMVSVICIILLVANNEILKPRISKVSPVPVPAELLVVVMGTTASYFLNLEERYHVSVLGNVPTGLPAPAPPPLELLPSVLTDSFLIAFISYTTAFSMAKSIAQRQGYTLDAEQELYAQGMSNVCGSFFSCGPVGNSIVRSLILEAVGGSTQLATFFCCVLLLFVLYVIGPLFETLPFCVLSSIILMSIKRLFLQVNDLFKLWSSSRLDAAIWLTTFVVSVVVNLDYGLLAGVMTSGVVLLLRSQWPPARHLGHVPSTDLYLDLNRYQKAVEVPGVKVFQFGGPLHFGNADYFHSSLFSITGLDLDAKPSSPSKDQLVDTHQFKEDNLRQGDADQDVVSEDGVTQVSTQDADSPATQTNRDLTHASMDDEAPKDSTCFTMPVSRWLVLDLSLVSFVDTTGTRLLMQLHRDLQPAGVTLCLASASDRVVDTLERCGALEEISRDLNFHSTHDAITAITCRGRPQSPDAFPGP